MSKKSRRQRQRAKQRNYAQVYNEPAATAPVITDSVTPLKPAEPMTASPSAALVRLQQAKNADLWDSLIFAGAIFVSFIVLYSINLRTPILTPFGNLISSLFGFSL